MGKGRVSVHMMHVAQYGGKGRRGSQLLAYVSNFWTPYVLENVEHCGGEPEQADRILMSDIIYSKFSVQCKLTQWNPH